MRRSYGVAKLFRMHPKDEARNRVRARTLKLLTLAALLPCWGLGCASSVVNNQGSTTTSGNKFLAFFMQPKAKTPTATQKNDPTALFTKTTKPGPELFVTMAQLREQAGETDEAEGLYQKALKTDPKSLPALMGYAHLEDRRGNLEAATKLYKRAISKHPEDVAPYNDLGLCFHRQGKLAESAQTLHQAVKMQPDKKLYRNNLAMVLVDLDRNDEALKELSIAGSPAAAHYNLASLLHRKGDDVAALDHFRQALATDPSLQAAGQWIAKLESEPSSTKTDSLLAGRLRSRTSRETPPQAGPAAPPAEVALPPEVNPPQQVAAQPPEMNPAHRAPIARPVSTRTARSAPEAAAPSSSQEIAPRAPSAPQFLYADETPYDSSTAPGIDAQRALTLPGHASADRSGAPHPVLPPEQAPDIEPFPAIGEEEVEAAAPPQAPNPPQFMYADKAPYGTPAADSDPSATEPVAAEQAKLSLTSDRAYGARIVRPTLESKRAYSGRGGAALSSNPPLFLHPEEPSAEESQATVPSMSGPSLSGTSRCRIGRYGFP